MPCFHPLSAWQSDVSGPGGKRPVFFGDYKVGAVALSLPCGRCIGCRLEKSRQWAVRMMHEHSMHDQSIFLTLTYDDEHLPSDYSLSVDVAQRFMKRYRKKYGPVRFYLAGEYGDVNYRPHYHAVIFGHEPQDKIRCNLGTADPLYVSESLQQVWPYGRAVFGAVTFESCAYVARYTCKKVTGEKAVAHYSRVLESTGECVQVLPEFSTMSRRPGIGANWYDKFSGDVYPLDRVVQRGKESKPPRAYDKLLEQTNPQLLEAIKLRRKIKSESLRSDEELLKLLRRLPQREEFVRLKQATFNRRKEL